MVGHNNKNHLDLFLDDASMASTSSNDSDDAVYSRMRTSSLNSAKLHPLVIDMALSDFVPSADAVAQQAEDKAKNSTACIASTTAPLSAHAFPRTGPPCLHSCYDDCSYDSEERRPRHRSTPSDNTKAIITLKMELAQAKSEADRQESLSRQLSKSNESLKAEIVEYQEDIRSLQSYIIDHADMVNERDELQAENERLGTEMERVLFERNKLKSQLGMMTVDFPPTDANKAETDDHRADAMDFLSRMASTTRLHLSCEKITPLHVSPDDLLWANDNDDGVIRRWEGPSAA